MLKSKKTKEKYKMKSTKFKGILIFFKNFIVLNIKRQVNLKKNIKTHVIRMLTLIKTVKFIKIFS